MELWTHPAAPSDPSDPCEPCLGIFLVLVLVEWFAIWDVPPWVVRGRCFPKKLRLDVSHRLRPLGGRRHDFPTIAPWLQVLVAAVT